MHLPSWWAGDESLGQPEPGRQIPLDSVAARFERPLSEPPSNPSELVAVAARSRSLGRAGQMLARSPEQVFAWGRVAARSYAHAMVEVPWAGNGVQAELLGQRDGVADHVKTLYVKLGAASRQELLARVFLDECPRLSSRRLLPIGPRSSRAPSSNIGRGE